MSKQRIVILGSGESGVGSAILAMSKGFDVFVSDFGKIKDKYKEILIANKIDFEEEKHTTEKILNATEVIKSPGIEDKVEIIKRLKALNVPVISEIEFAARYTNAKLIAITGTNGKTTTTLLTYHILKNSGLNVGLAGNIGKSFALQVAQNNFDYYVLELSSFQLDGMFDTKINIAILVNITPDHLDRYDYKVENYIASKFRIVQNQTAADVFIYCADDTLTNQYISNYKIQAKQLPFSIKKEIIEGAFLNENQLTININNNSSTMAINELALQGKHNLYNSMAAGIASRVLDIRKESIRESLSDFQNIEHRLEFVTKVHGIEFINDSKATNINSTWYALESMTNPTVWIVGGVDKGNDYTELVELVKDKVKAIVCLGVDNAKIHEAFEGSVEAIVDAASAEEAVKAAYKLGKKGDTVLLSPACASFDLFENYEDRGRQFKTAVRGL
ncbi:MAG: UDP-N-acetylmuramoyl-L-alanine--D-glutamate ligase [Bacteroidota bacterium]